MSFPIFPIDAVFNSVLTDATNQPNIIIGSTVSNPLFWTLTNNATETGQDLVVTPFSSGGASTTQFHFVISFSPGTLVAVPSMTDWSTAVETDSYNAITALYLAYSGTAPLTIAPGSSQITDWTYTTAIQENTSTVSVTVTAGQNVTLAGISIEGKAFGPSSLNLVPAGTLSLSVPPISVDFVGRKTVINDGQTPNTFTFALTNLTLAALPLIPSGGNSATTFNVWFDAAPNDSSTAYAWALAEVQQLASTNVNLAPPSSDWAVSQSTSATEVTMAGNPQWSLTVSDAVSLQPQTPLLFTFSGIVTGLDPGVTRMYLQFQNLPGYADGILVAELEKSPLIYGTTQGQGVYLSAGTYQGTTPPAPSFDSGLTIRQFGAQPAATFNGGTGLFVLAAQGPAATLGGGIVINANEELPGVQVNASTDQTGVNVVQTGTGQALQVQGGSTFDGVLQANDVANVTGLLTASGGVTVNGNQTNNGAVIINAADGGTPTLTIQQNSAEPALEVMGTSSFANDVQLQSTATVAGLLTCNSGANMNGTVNLNNAVVIPPQANGGQLQMGVWTIFVDDNGNLNFSSDVENFTFNRGGDIYCANLTLNGRTPIISGSPINVYSPGRGAYLNATSKDPFSDDPENFSAATYWMYDPDSDSNLIINSGNPF